MAAAGEHAKHPSATKRGPSRYHSAVKSGKAKKTNFAAALMAHWAAKRAGSKAHKAKHTLRDEHGAITLVGARIDYIEPRGEPSPLVQRLGADKCRRVWLAGISAQRGF